MINTIIYIQVCTKNIQLRGKRSFKVRVSVWLQSPSTHSLPTPHSRNSRTFGLSQNLILPTNHLNIAHKPRAWILIQTWTNSFDTFWKCLVRNMLCLGFLDKAYFNSKLNLTTPALKFKLWQFRFSNSLSAGPRKLCLNFV